MSEENVEMVRRLLDAWNRRDLDAMLDLGGSELVFVNSPTAVEPGTRRGRDEVIEVARKQWEILADARFEVDRFFDRGDEIIALARLSRSMPGSDTRIEEPVLGSYRRAAEARAPPRGEMKQPRLDKRGKCAWCGRPVP